MTRINVGVNPKLLTDKHLLAEHREIIRIPNMIRSGKAKIDHIPEQFTLGTGHVKFFYDKLQFLQKRYVSIYDECLLRGFNVQCYLDSFQEVPYKLFNDYQPTERDIKLIMDRIKERTKVNHKTTIY